MDFYLLCARYWGKSRVYAKVRVVNMYLRAGGAPDAVVKEAADEGCWPSFCRTAQLQPYVLDHIPLEARFEILDHYGIHLGVN